MELIDIPVGAKIIIKSSYYDKKEYGEKFVNLESAVVRILKHGIIVERIKDEDSVISFHSDLVQNDLYLLSDDKPPYVWEDIGLYKIKLDGEVYHAVAQKRPGYKLNRRGAFRVSVSVRGTAQYVGEEPVEAVVRDISASGVAFIVQEDKINPGDDAIVSFSDGPSRLIFNCMCVRKEILPDERILYGCIIRGCPEEVKMYIDKKQQEIIERNRMR